LLHAGNGALTSIVCYNFRWAGL